MTGYDMKPCRVHIGCGGVVLWGISGGVCIRCNAENLDPDDAERGWLRVPEADS